MCDEPVHDEKVSGGIQGTGGETGGRVGTIYCRDPRDLGVNANTLHTWIGKYHRVERQEKDVHDEHLYEELKRLRKENARLTLQRHLIRS
jgi:hypothetical protein